MGIVTGAGEALGAGITLAVSRLGMSIVVVDSDSDIDIARAEAAAASRGLARRLIFTGEQLRRLPLWRSA